MMDILKLTTKEEVFSKYSKMTIVKDILKVPDGKRLLAISKMYHTSGETAIEINENSQSKLLCCGTGEFNGG